MGDRSQVAIVKKPRRSDATFWADGTQTDHAYWGQWQARRWKRAGWKKTAEWAGFVLVSGTVGAGMLDRPAATERVTAAACGLVLATGALRGLFWWEGWNHYRNKVRPFALAITVAAGQPVSNLRAWAHVPRDYLTRKGAEVVVDVAHDFTGAERDMEDITRAATVKLGLVNPKITKALDSRRPRLILAQNLPPPKEVSLEDIRPRIDIVKPSVVVLGLAAKNEFVELDLDSETPMVGVSIETGGGKSEFAKNLAAQQLFHGAIVMILDYKMVSHMWADQLPSVSYARTPAEIQEALIWLAWDDYDSDGNIIRPSELTRRKQVVLAAKRRGETPNVGPRIVILAEERNATNRAIRRFHRRMGGKGSPPALESLDETGETGRQVRVNKLDIAQRLSAKASGSDGSADARENVGAVVTWDPKEQTWNMIAGGHAQPPRSGHKGRYQLITNAGVTVFQGVLYDKDPDESDRIARELAMSGIIGQVPHDMPFVNRGPLLVPADVRHADSGGMEAPDLGLVTTVPTALPMGGTVKLADMVAAGLFVTIAAARRRSTRDPLFPRPVGGDKAAGYRYAVTEVHQYLAAKGKR